MITPFFVHQTAVVDDGVQIGSGSKVWHFSHLMPGSSIGMSCIIGQNVFIDRDVKVGSGVKIQNNVSLYQGVVVEDDVFIGPSAVFTNVINPRSFVERKHEFKSTLIGRGSTIGANATVLCGVKVGEYALVGAGAVVTKNVKPFSLVYGSPATHKGWISKLGYPLDFNSKGKALCPASGDCYRLIEDSVVSVPAFNE